MEAKIICLDSVGSTNNYLLNMIDNQAVEAWTVIWANEQTEGKGHGSGSWESGAGLNLTFSLLLKPYFIPPSKQFVITQIVSIALFKVLKSYISDEPVKIKWPNDIYIGDKKVAGMLIQNVIRGSQLEYTIVGIGLNVNQKVFYSDAPNPTSMALVKGVKYDLEKLLHELLHEIHVAYINSASSRSLKSLSTSYLENLYQVNEWHNYECKGEEFVGMIAGIGNFGKLQMKLKNGSKKEFEFKEVTFL